MKRKRIFYCLLAAIIIPLSLASCSDSFLNIPNDGAVDASTALTTVGGLRTALNGLYSELQSDEYYGRTFTLLPDLLSDNVFLSKKNSGRYVELNEYIATAQNGYAEGLWNTIYRVIANANLIINNGEKLKLSNKTKKAEKRAVVGQAYALRAEGYFDLVRLFAQPYNFTADASQPGVPIVTNTQVTLPAKVNKPKRSSVKAVYEQIISDFKQAISLLPTSLPGLSSSFKGKITKNAAKALLSRVYLYKEDWSDCMKMATDVISSHQYKLLSTADLISGFNTKNSSESIFEVVNTPQDNLGSNSLGYFYNQHESYGDALATHDLYNIYAPSDVRRQFMKIGDRNRSGAEVNVPLVLKYGTILAGNQDIIVIRLAEVYLNRAEAEAH